MIDRIISFSIHHKLMVGLMTLAMVVGGIWSLSQIPLDAVPDITNNQVQIITQAPNLGTEDMEQFVTYPVEISMSNLPGVTEIRSVSRFGLSLVTIVFEDDMGTYLPRQLVAEKLNEVRKNIPEGFGEPMMGPISTGLGEIYQYTLEVDSAHENNYTAQELRVIQDWIIRRQMAMVPGVVEVNGFGGNIRQYEVAISPDRLNAMGLTITQVYEALQKNNQNTGAAYIEKDHYANFIRGEGLARNIRDIEKSVVINQNGIPVTIGDIATVQYGQAIRYGAFTKDGKGEAVGGMILMLKGSNSNNVIAAVKERVEEIQKSLPEGVRIEPFLDRSKLIGKTTETVSRNLLEGALIVLFVLVFLLGNWRGGLIVASTIPLSLLFAFILMHFFGVWANLMSLGAIDFGIIVDGAVIIVESVVFVLSKRVLEGKQLGSKERDEVAQKTSSKMMNAAFFGQLIILLVFIPILALEGIEGKMFRPMALTFMFAMIGVMVLCLTYVPMMSAWLLRVNPHRKYWGDRLVKYLENAYQPVLKGMLKRGGAVLSGAVLLLALAGFTFFRLGGEFIPQLDEGDIAFHAILKPGSSLTETVETTTRIEKMVKDRFPEVKHIMSRIGVAEVPTDPMPMDIADIFVILHPQETWTTVKSKAELIREMKKTVQVIPGINFEFSQPIEMRFNELITGVREDVAVKLFGDDLTILAEKAEEMGQIIASVEGVGDMKVESTKGLPQMTIHYNRQKLAQYGLSIEDVNQVVEAAFAGRKAGVIFEGEKRFDLVVRLANRHRKSINDLKQLFVYLPNGNQIPLKEIADIHYEPGPMQISRDNTNRRTYVGINVRGRDVQSMVQEIQEKLDAELDLPPGYYIRYGGAFENLERASQRMQVLVPLALGLIFLLLFIALKSIKQTLMIFMAIPLAALGGVFSLWLRDMPFSISAGVGFIVLFGVAVLNGLVLITSWNELKKDASLSLNDRILIGAKRRIRPILLTALTDILGFLPMAISTSAGAEVQQPLATVVIGGMISATLLTLFVLPILYRWIEKGSSPKLSPVVAGVALILGAFLFVPNTMNAQENEPITRLDQALKIALQNNGFVRVARSQVEWQEQQKKAAVDPGKTWVEVQYGQYNSFENDLGVTISQQLEFPTVYTAQNKLAKEQVRGSQWEQAITENQLRQRVRRSWYQLSYLQERRELLNYQDSLYQRFLWAARLRYETEASTYLELAAAETQVMEVQNALRLTEADLSIQEQELRVLLNDSVPRSFNPDQIPNRTLAVFKDSNNLNKNPQLALVQQQIEIARAEKAVYNAQMLPDLKVGYFNVSMTGNPTADGGIASSSDRFSGVQAGIAVPLFFGSYKADIKSAKIKGEMAEIQADYYQTALQGLYNQQVQEVLKFQSSMEYYENKAVPQAELIIDNAQKSFENGAIGYVEYFQNLDRALELKMDYLKTQNGYNQSIIDLEYLVGQ
ncbi:CusA/CzcA family heavy metal efflux RND transporter [bacterium SCSIO 12741]|nr:CusA/CzcA family heavy metal efflux RND transporter [bacterium SCSIO 12741]